MTLSWQIAELLRYRELVRNLVWRDLKARYKNSVLGFLWSLVNPLLMMAVFTFVFTVMMPNNNIDKFPVFVLCALLPWNWFTTSVMGATHSIVGNAHLIKKVYFPREVLPISVVLSNMINFLLALSVLFAMMLLFQVRFTAWALLLPVVILIQLVFTLGLAFILGTLNVFYRDTGVIMEVVLLAWFFLTPIFYPIDVLPAHRILFGFDLDLHRLAYIVNPMASLIATYRVILYSGAPPAFDFLVRTVVTALIVLALGYLFFNRYSRVFGEEV
jgi:ABC-type polysaccharide/polyol phosphate export permease